jgi:hypothetical protein
MVVAVVAMPMMQASVDQIVEMIAVRHERMSAAIVSAETRNRRATVRIGGADFDDMLVVVIAVFGVQVTIVQVVNVIAMHNAQMSAMLGMLVRVVGVYFVIHQLMPFSRT